jgi:predicted lipoprotein with Yx(FWY)xxD motif
VKRMTIALTLTAIVVVALVATQVAVAAHAARAAKVQVRHTSLGNLLANGQGFTLYTFTKDGRKRDRCVSISGCTGVWPMLKTSARPVAGSGVRHSLLGTIKLAGGARQVTYAGHPLYTYSGDFGPGQTSYVGASQFGGTWNAINAAGRTVK